MKWNKWESKTLLSIQIADIGKETQLSHQTNESGNVDYNCITHLKPWTKSINI